MYQTKGRVLQHYTTIEYTFYPQQGNHILTVSITPEFLTTRTHLKCSPPYIRTGTYVHIEQFLRICKYSTRVQSTEHRQQYILYEQVFHKNIKMYPRIKIENRRNSIICKTEQCSLNKLQRRPSLSAFLDIQSNLGQSFLLPCFLFHAVQVSCTATAQGSYTIILLLLAAFAVPRLATIHNASLAVGAPLCYTRV